MMARRWGHIVNMSPPVDFSYLKGHVAYLISKFGMTMLTHGLAEEVRESGIAVHSLWPATAIESNATIHFQLGGPEQWRKASIMADALLCIVGREPAASTGRALLDEEVLREEGVEEFESYSCVPGGKPLRIAKLP
jgi:citronellol/citronellal dehydrogenase